MTRRTVLHALALAAAFLAGRWLDAGGPAPAWANEGTVVADGATFVSTEEGNAYLWRRDGDRIVLLNHCSRLPEGSTGQATYVSLPGVERGS